MKKNVEIEFCDVCDFDQSKINELTSTRDCDVCERKLCANSKHTGHRMEFSRYAITPFNRFVCSDCWELANKDIGSWSDKINLPIENIDTHQSGNSTSIHLANFMESVRAHIEDKAAQTVVEAIKAIRVNKLTEVNAAEMLKKLEEEYELRKKQVVSKVNNYYKED